MPSTAVAVALPTGRGTVAWHPCRSYTALASVLSRQCAASVPPVCTAIGTASSRQWQLPPTGAYTVASSLA